MANKLIDEQSPYLLQHAHNPVDWYPWGDEAFARAKEEHKPVLVSIGYAACHWCHVMERESFENEDVAAYMNEHFICIKVDREEHPDVDHIYMDAVQAIGGSGGWPLNVFVTPDRVPFYGGTYYPPRPAYNRPSWPQLLQRMSAVWTDNHDEVTLQADQMVKHLQQASQRMLATADDKHIDKDTCRQIADTLLKQADKEQGGFGNAPKFPGTMAISYLLEHYQFSGHEPSLKHALRSIDAMIEGGIYDQAGGGFARYATDREWLVPHFEKMLYDNALLISALCDAYSITKAPRYKEVIEETIAFAERELKDASGGYYCALDADSEGVEGKFYTWTWEEWQAVIGDNEIAEMYFGITPGGNWEHTNILHVNKPMEDVASTLKVPLEAVLQQVQAVKERVMQERTKRVRPQTDDKSLLSWNALMNIALSKAGAVLQNEAYLHRATAHMQWMLHAFRNSEGQLLHTWKQGTAKITAKLDDHAYLIQALLQLASATGDNGWIVMASELIMAVVADFSREDGFFYYTPATQQDIPVRKVDLYDGATPSANAVLAHSLWLCGLCMERTDWVERAKSMLKNMADTMLRYAYSFGYWALLLQRDVMGEKTVVCAGNEADTLRRQFQKKYLPHAFVLTCKKEISEVPVLAGKFLRGEMGIFVCTEQACLPPVHSVDDAFFLIYR